MKKITAAAIITFMSGALSAQYMIIGNDSLSLETYKKENLYGLQNNGVDKTIASTQDFLLLQQFAHDKKVDTTASFRERMFQRESELRAEKLYPTSVIDPVVADYVKSNQVEKKVQIFMVAKEEGDTNNYKQIYSDVKSGKMTMDEAITKYTKNNPKPLYIKPGSLDNKIYSEVKNLGNNAFTTLHESPSFAAFAKVLDSRPSLGYVIFGTISYPNDANAEAQKTKIMGALNSGKKFAEVAKEFGSTESERESAGVIMGSPTLPDEAYAQLKGKKAGEFSQPILFGDKYFVFGVFNVEPYNLTAQNREFFNREMNNTLYAELVEDRMIEHIKAQPKYKLMPQFSALKKSYAAFATAKDTDVLYEYAGQKTTVADVKKLIEPRKDEIAKLPVSVWGEIMDGVQSQMLFGAYSNDFSNRKDVKEEMNNFRRMLYSDYIFSSYLSNEIAQNPQWLTDYYNKNKSKYMWETRADGRVAIIADEKLIKEVAKDIKDPKKWEALKSRYNGKLNDKNQILVHFEKGEMSADADVFTKYNVPFKTGVHQTKMGERYLVIAVDQILQPTQMTQEEATSLLQEAVTDQRLREIIAEQKAKTKIVIQPEFIRDLEKNFKK